MSNSNLPVIPIDDVLDRDWQQTKQAYIVFRKNDALINSVFGLDDEPSSHRDSIISLITNLYEAIKVSYNPSIHQMINAADELLLKSLSDEDLIHEKSIRKLIFESFAENNPENAEDRYKIGQDVRDNYNYHKNSVESLI